MNSNIKCGASINGGLVLTDMPIEALKAMRDSIDDAIQQYQEQEKDKYFTDILAAIDAARDAGYEVYINGLPYDGEDDLELYNGNEDDEDDEDEDDDPCYGCREDCLHCPYGD
jgi:hypothetical protein